MASLISRLQRRYILEGDQLAHDAETCIGELCAALRKIADLAGGDSMYPSGHDDIYRTAIQALTKCAEGI